jgi:2-dehydropantoate 2-reductase
MMRIAVMGAGGVGGYYGALLAQGGHDVVFIARGAHRAAMEATGQLRVHSVHGDLIVSPVQVVSDPGGLPPADWILVTVKTPDTESAARTIRPLVDPHTTVTSFQNGIDAAERIGDVIGTDHLLGAATWISSFIESPGVIRQVSPFRRVALGEFDGAITPRTRDIEGALTAAGVDVTVTGDIRGVLWRKLLFISAISGVGAVTRLPVGGYRHVPETRHLLRTLMEEVHAVAGAEGVALAPGAVDEAMALVDNSPADIKASLQRDVEAGRPSELDSMLGVLVRRGAAAGVPTPAAAFVYAALLPAEHLARAETPPAGP